MGARGKLVVLLMAIGAAAACDRTPVEPFDDPAIAVLTGTQGERPSELTLSGLLYSAIRRIHGDHGLDAARDLVRDLALIQHRIDAAAVEDRPGLHRQLRQEQLRIVLLVHDGDVIDRTIRGVAEQAAILRSRRHALARSGIAAPGADGVLEDLPALLARARTSANEFDALDAATRAAEHAERLRHAIAGAARLPSLDTLFNDAAARIGDSALKHLIRDAETLRATAEAAVRSGVSERADAATRAARDARIRAILAGLGPDAVADVIDWGQHRVGEQEARLRTVAAARDVSRLERMNASAADMLQRAETRLRLGDSAAALDLAAHAVDLLNALEGTLTDR
ncbi:MAG: hypothetical protein KFH98_05350 [Gemmatimonadetes bacterium]|nr:hypothetical protein [Gemmatimonadota bacterium]